MRLQQKILLITCVSLVGLFLVLLVPGGLIIWRGFSRLEAEMVVNHANRARAALDEQLAGLARTAGDWASWDDTWHFVEDRNPAYLESNLDDGSLDTLELNLMAFVNNSGELVYGKTMGRAAGEGEAFPEGLRQAMLVSNLRSSEDPSASARCGLLLFPEGPMLAAVAPILRNNREGPVRGTLILGRWLDDTEVERLSRLANVPLTFRPLDSPLLSAEERKWASDAMQSETPLVRLLNRNDAAGYFVVLDLLDKPAVLGCVRTPRKVMAEGRASLLYSTVFFLVASVCFALLAWFFANRIVLSRLLRLAGDVKKSADRGYPTPNICVSGNDELTDLGSAINGMLRQIRSSVHQLRKASVAAQQASRTKSEFLANMSHEIRTPLTAILGFADILMERLDDPDDAVAAETIKRNGQHLLDLINDILDLSKVEAGKMQVECAACSPCQVASEVVTLMKIRANEKCLPLTVEYVGPLPAMIQTDVTRFRQILINLLGNAIKFTECGKVHLRVRMLHEDGKTPRMGFDVIDTGIGISQEQLARLFEPFSQADGSTTRRFGGSGLGLAISRQLARKLGGDIHVASQTGLGSTFSLTIATGPLEGVRMLDNPSVNLGLASDGPLGQSPVSDPVRLDGRILLVEDGPDNQRLIAFLLRKAGAEVAIVENGQLACCKVLGGRSNARAHDAERPAAETDGPVKFDLILMDMQMPVMDGYEATRQLRQAGYAGPIIALTAHAMKHDRETCLGAGCDAYLAKPIDRRTLLTTVADHLRRHRQKAASAGESLAQAVAGMPRA